MTNGKVDKLVYMVRRLEEARALAEAEGEDMLALIIDQALDEARLQLLNARALAEDR